MGIVRFTVADECGTASFLGPGHGIKALVAACTKDPQTLKELLHYARTYDDVWVSEVVNGLNQFDEHNLHDQTEHIDSLLSTTNPAVWPPFRVLSQRTRMASTEPGRVGLIVINLSAKRIVQVQNSYAEIQRRDRGRIRAAGRPTTRLYHYSLPVEWVLLP